MRSIAAAISARMRAIAVRALVIVNGGLAAGFALSEFRHLATPQSSLISDFTVFWTGWTLILQHRAAALYDEAAQRATQQALLHGMHFEGGLMAFLNPPHAALVSAPVGWLADRAGEQAAFVIWSACTVAVLALLVRAVCDAWGGTGRQQRWMIALALVAYHPVFCAIKQGQTSILLALAVIGLYQAAEDDRPWAGGAWLLVLTIKPQLAPMLVVYLAARRSWRLLWCGGVLISASVVVTAVVLGPSVWIDYLRHVRPLEQFWGTGTPEYMLNVRGWLTRMFGFDAHVWIDHVSDLVWIAAMAVTGALMFTRRIFEQRDRRPAYAFVVAMMLASNPHVFVHDAVIWVVPLVLFAASMRDAGAEWRGFARFALLWPLLFAVGGFFNVKSAPLTLADPRMWALAGATLAIAASWRSTSPAAGPRAWRVPATAAIGARALSFVAFLVIICFLAGTAPDADLWGHLTFGRDIVHAGAVHGADPYSFASDRAWINHEWLAEVVMWMAYRLAGAAGLVALKLALACAAGAALLATWRAYALRPAMRDGLLFLTALGTWPLLATIRPQAFSVCLFAVLLFVLARARSGSERWLGVLPLLFAVWVNVHGGWIVGAAALAIVVACSWFDAAWTARRRGLLLAAAIASALATLCNPYGVSMLGFLAETVRPGRTDILEWQSATRVPIVGLLLWLVPTAMALWQIWSQRRRPSPAALLVVLLLSVGSFRVIRLVGFYALAVGFLIVPSVRTPAVDDENATVNPVAVWAWQAVVSAALVLVAVAMFGRTLAMDAEWLPEREATVFVKTHDISGRMLTWFDYGEFAIWHFSPALRVSMDGRRETVYSEEVRDRHFRIYTNAPDALDQVARLDPDYVWLPARFPVVGRLEAAGWHAVFTGSRSVILSRRTPAAIAAAFELAPSQRAFPGP
jgi:hypothetical protein